MLLVTPRMSSSRSTSITNCLNFTVTLEMLKNSLNTLWTIKYCILHIFHMYWTLGPKETTQTCTSCSSKTWKKLELFQSNHHFIPNIMSILTQSTRIYEEKLKKCPLFSTNHLIMSSWKISRSICDLIISKRTKPSIMRLAKPLVLWTRTESSFEKVIFCLLRPNF